MTRLGLGGVRLCERVLRLAEADDIEAAEHTSDPDAPLPAHVKVSRPGHTRSKVLQVRLNPEEMAALEEIAKRRELPASTVVREQILRLLDADAGDAGPLGHLLVAAEQVTEYAREVRRQLGPAVTYRPDGRLVRK